MSLENEIQNDPLVRGYTGMTDVEVANSLNDTEDRPRNKASMSGREVMDEVVDSEYDGLTSAQKTQFISLTSGGDLDPFGFAANVVKNIFGNPSNTLTALAAARVELVSRAEELGFGEVTFQQVWEIRR